MLQTNLIEYRDQDVVLEGFYANDTSRPGPKPLVLVSHDWSGKNEFACEKAKRLAELGYVGFALDMFGKGKMGKTKEEKSALIQPLIQDRNKLEKRIQTALNTGKQLEGVNPAKTAAIGFCFGGLCVLDLARSGADVTGVVSFHGLLQTPERSKPPTIKAKVLALHGYDDPMVTPEHVMNFANEMTAAKADWQLHMYGHTMHGFTNPDANDPVFGTVYNKTVDKRSWQSMKDFFVEIFGV